jgi:putative addiction module CopG family antidote
MEIPLSEDLQQFIEFQVTEGRYPSHREVVEMALRLMREQEATSSRPASIEVDEGHDRFNQAMRLPNVSALAILQAVRERQRCRPVSDSIKTQEYLHEARSGGMYGHDDDARESIVERGD